MIGYERSIPLSHLIMMLSPINSEFTCGMLHNFPSVLLPMCESAMPLNCKVNCPPNITYQILGLRSCDDSSPVQILSFDHSRLIIHDMVNRSQQLCCEVGYIDVWKMSEKVQSNQRLLYAARCQLSTQGLSPKCNNERQITSMTSFPCSKFTDCVKKINRVLIP